MTMRIIVYSGNRLFGQCLCHGLLERPEIEHAQTCDDASAVGRAASDNRASVVLVDMGDPASERAARGATAAMPDIPVLALAIDDRAARDILECARLGCRGFVPRDASLTDLVRIVGAAMRGEVAVRPTVAARMMQALAERDAAARRDFPNCLTRREKEVCSLICEGLTNKEIAREVGRSVGTVKNQVGAILSKLDAPCRSAIHSRLELAGVTWQGGRGRIAARRDAAAVVPGDRPAGGRSGCGADAERAASARGDLLDGRHDGRGRRHQRQFKECASASETGSPSSSAEAGWASTASRKM